MTLDPTGTTGRYPCIMTDLILCIRLIFEDNTEFFPNSSFLNLNFIRTHSSKDLDYIVSMVYTLSIVL